MIVNREWSEKNMRMKILIMILFIALACLAATEQKPIIAVITLDCINCDKAIGEAVTEILRTELGGTLAFNIADGGKVKQVMGRLKYSPADLENTEICVGLGKELGADYVALGSVMKLGETYTLAGRLVNIAEGEIAMGKTLTANAEDNLPDVCRNMAEMMAVSGGATITKKPLAVETNGTNGRPKPTTIYFGKLESKSMGPDLKMIRIPGGTFEMGSYAGNQDEQPVHTVVLDGFWMSESEVTNAQYVQFLNTNKPKPDKLKKWLRLDDEEKQTHILLENGKFAAEKGWETHPVVNVSWHGAKAFCDYYGLRLPSEAEWEYAAGGPSHFRYPWGNNSDSKEANFADTHGSAKPPTTPIKFYRPNGFGLFDIAGNVWEWCDDWYKWDYYLSGAEKNPKGPNGGSVRIIRGGSWYDFMNNLRTANRDFASPDFQLSNYGFRPVAK